MDYDRIHKVQTGILSPSKLRMKLMGSHHQKRSNSISSRTSPVRMEDSEFAKDSLLAAENGDFGEEALNLEVSQVKSGGASQGDGNSLQLKANGDASRFRMQLLSKGDTGNSSSVHPIRMTEDENLDYDSTSSFEFHKGERSLHHSITRSFSRPMSSKWNDAEKWIMNKKNVQSNISKKANIQNQVNRQPAKMVRVVPEPSVKRVDFCQSASQTGPGKYALMDLCPESNGVTDETTDPAIRSVSMRDMGTEMTPVPSQEPSRSTTPVSPTTPIRSPMSSIPSTPRRGEQAPTPTEHSISNSTQNLAEHAKKELSEQEQKLKTRREIVALGVQLGKMNIAAWASKDETDESDSGYEAIDNDELTPTEYTKRAAAWEEAEYAKHAARYKREEIRIQAWESQQKAKLEAEMRQIEAQIEQMKAQAQAKMVKKVAMARRKSEEKRALAEARKKQQAEKTALQAEYICDTGRIPSSTFICCGWS
ncbi:hypothetical protein SASPL_124197 [Salvia splendens]|uniref:Remorin C-terminal domain-containing protein n=1 Tax=Salvia splendens TaxID=180675 RepID=A0A8X8ZUR0_SALSN|nr:titin homolog isoform X2 [Salvia splendens]KAG6416759.1 hypothetical protein SASPL_124197 [Salvia splendens]